MATYVRACDTGTLRERVEATGRHGDVAVQAGISPVRLSQILSGSSPVLQLSQAVRLEDAIGVERGSLFVLDDDTPDASELIRPYLRDLHRVPRDAA